jgi:hypothetical protein
VLWLFNPPTNRDALPTATLSHLNFSLFFFTVNILSALQLKNITRKLVVYRHVSVMDSNSFISPSPVPSLSFFFLSHSFIPYALLKENIFTNMKKKLIAQKKKENLIS